MPILNVKIGAERSVQTHAKVIKMLNDCTCTILGKKRELIAIVVHYIDPADWFVEGRSLQEWGKNSFYLDIKITDETNTKDEKAAFIRTVFDDFATLFGSLHEESYIHIEDVRAASYGYGGKTQEFRYQHRVS